MPTINAITDLTWLGLSCVDDYANIPLWSKGNMGFEYIGQVGGQKYNSSKCQTIHFMSWIFSVTLFSVGNKALGSCQRINNGRNYDDN